MKLKKFSKVTIEKLAGMVQRGFNDTSSRMERGFKRVDDKFKIVNNRFDHIEVFLIKEHARQIQELQKRVQRLEEALAIR